MVRTLGELDGLIFRNNSKNLPHPVDLQRWSDAGYYYIDPDNDCFRLTALGKDLAKREASQ